jgi:hypothetical protein
MLVLTVAASGSGDACRGSSGAPSGSAIAAPASAEGPYRFTEQAWLRALTQMGSGGAQERYRARIFRTTSGRYYVPTESERGEILALRRDVRIACPAAQALAAENVRSLHATLGRPPIASDLYLAHVYGRETAARMSTLAKDKPGEMARSHLPELGAAASEPGARMTLAQLYERLALALAANRKSQPPITDMKVPEPRRAAPRAVGENASEPRSTLLEGLSAAGGLAKAGWETEVRETR